MGVGVGGWKYMFTTGTGAVWWGRITAWIHAARPDVGSRGDPLSQAGSIYRILTQVGYVTDWIQAARQDAGSRLDPHTQT